MKQKKILPVIVIAQFFCTSVWFAGNAVMGDIVKQLSLQPAYLAHLTSAVQLGFITGTLVFAILSVADKFSPVKVFFSCAVLAAMINLGACIERVDTYGLIFCRFATGFFLAGIYPVGMKIASDHYREGLGKSLGFLVGALVLGTAFPHLLKVITINLPWKSVFYLTSGLSVLGGCSMVLLVPDGPGRVSTPKFKLTGFLKGFKDSSFRSAAFGYFGHMWELYAFWVFVPVILKTYQDRHPLALFNIPLLSFFIIAAGSFSCVLSGYLSQHYTAKRVATAALVLSCCCCMVSPLILSGNSTWLLILFMFIWSMAVIADSPLFSTLVAQNAPASSKGASLTIVNCIGFAVSVISIQLIGTLRTINDAPYIYALLAVGPILGLAALVSNKGQAKYDG